MPAEIIDIEPLDCPECGSPMLLRKGKFKQFFGCSRWPICSGTHGAHPSGEPLGVPANEETKRARRNAHAALERIEAIIGRPAAYKWLATVLHVEPAQCHIGMFDQEMCAKVVGAVTTYTRGKRS
jgi:ssDNA-binding Zn-finger/Zn-ribbon topoisomerase 1